MVFGGFGWGGGGYWWFGLIGLLLFAFLIGSLIWFLVAFTRPRPYARRFPGPGPGWYGPYAGRSQALEELDIAYARGQLSREEYFRRRADLTGWGPPGGPGAGFAGGYGPAGPGPGAPGPGADPGAGGDPGSPSSS